MLPFSIVENLDVLDGGRLGLSLSHIANAMPPLIPETVEPTPRHRQR